MSSFTQPHVVHNPYELLWLLFIFNQIAKFKSYFLYIFNTTVAQLKYIGYSHNQAS